MEGEIEGLGRREEVEGSGEMLEFAERSLLEFVLMAKRVNSLLNLLNVRWEFQYSAWDFASGFQMRTAVIVDWPHLSVV